MCLFLYICSQYLDGTAQDQIKASFAIFIIPERSSINYNQASNILWNLEEYSASVKVYLSLNQK